MSYTYYGYTNLWLYLLWLCLLEEGGERVAQIRGDDGGGCLHGTQPEVVAWLGVG